MLMGSIIIFHDTTSIFLKCFPYMVPTFSFSHISGTFLARFPTFFRGLTGLASLLEHGAGGWQERLLMDQNRTGDITDITIMI